MALHLVGTSTVASLLGLSQKATWYFGEVQGRFHHSLIPEYLFALSHVVWAGRNPDSIILSKRRLSRCKHLLVSQYNSLEPLF